MHDLRHPNLGSPNQNSFFVYTSVAAGLDRSCVDWVRRLRHDILLPPARRRPVMLPRASPPAAAYDWTIGPRWFRRGSGRKMSGS